MTAVPILGARREVRRARLLAAARAAVGSARRGLRCAVARAPGAAVADGLREEHITAGLNFGDT